MIGTIVISLLLAGLALSIRSVVTRRKEVLIIGDDQRQQVINLKILEQLFSPDENRYLQENLSQAEYQRIQRKRAALAMRYLRLLNQHIGHSLIQTASMGSSQRDENISMIANSLRVKIVIAQFYLVIQWLFPAADLSQWAGFARLFKALGEAAKLEARGSVIG